MALRTQPGTTWDHLRKLLSGLMALLKWLLGKGSGKMGGLATAGRGFLAIR